MRALAVAVLAAGALAGSAQAAWVERAPIPVPRPPLREPGVS